VIMFAGLNEKTVPKKVVLLESDIQEGQRGSCVFCPVAMAVNRLLERRFFVTVRSVITFRMGNPYTDDWDSDGAWVAAAAMPYEMMLWINGFDVANKRDVKPDEFTVWIPERLLAFKGYEVT
jgi:hypothetical protein